MADIEYDPGNSYGTTTARVALSRSDIHVDRFIALASAGLLDSVTSADDLLGERWSGARRDRTATADLAEVESRWRKQGMTIERQGSAAHPTVVGRGSAVTDSISSTVTDDQYGVQALSRCFPGDPDAR